ncbi:MAG TPA: VIT and VWA domain-containing protein [Tepidisphaeraceae bacterium]|nr:VIT and VWA domain-containing protein [Tepidisphaeraceae bacterium]
MFCALPSIASRRCLSALPLLLILLLASLARADGFIVIEQSAVIRSGPSVKFAFAPLEVTYHHVDVQIHDLVATTSVDQEFYNPNGQRLEGKYIFPLPAGAHIDKFQMDIDGQMQQAELLDSNKARQYYEEIVRKMRDPALLEYVGRDAFSVRIFPIEPHATKRIKVSYTQLLKSDSSLVEYSYPLNTEKFSARPLREVAISVNIESKDPIKNLYSPSHPVSVRYEGDRRATVGWEARNLFPDTDFKLLFSRTQKPLGIDLLTYRGANDGYFLLMASPGMVAPHGTAQSKDICFIIDTSGSMAEDGGKKIEQARKSLSFCLQNLSKEDRFNVIRFSTDVEPLFDNLVDADRKDVQKAQEFVDGLRPLGATAINDALLKAISMRPRDSKRPYIIIFITDGLPTVGVTGEDQILSNVQHGDSAATRIYCFGLGTDVNTHLLDRLADQTNAISQYVLPNEDLELKLSDFYTKIKEPVLADVNVKFDAPGVRVRELYPTRMPDLYKGQMLVLFGRYSGSGAGSVHISGSVNGASQEFVTDVNFGKGDRGNDFVPRLWATRRVGYLLDEIRMHGETAELKDEVTRLARQWGIVTPYTAYLIVEDETRRNVPAELQSMRELSTDAAVRASVQKQYYSARAEAKDVGRQTGAQAVENAQSLAQLKRSDNLDAPQQQQMAGLQKAAAARPGEPATQPSYRAAQNYAEQARIVGGRAFYQNGQTWTDASAQDAVAKNNNLKARQIKFGSDEYFALLTKYPHAAQWLALGNQVDLMLDGELVQVR